MSPELQDKLIKFGGGVVLIAILIFAVRMLKDEPEVLATVMAMLGGVYGTLGYNTPVKAIQNMRGLVSVNAPSAHEVDKMRDAIKVADSVPPADAGQDS